MKMLSAEQKSQFRENGYLIIEGLFDQGAIESLKTAARRMIDDFDFDQHRTVFSATEGQTNENAYFLASGERVSCFLEADALDEAGQLQSPPDQSINKIGHALHDLIPEVRQFCSAQVFKDILADLNWSKPELWQSMYIMKPPRIGGEVRWHQDATFLISKPSSVLGMWVAIEDANRENGCLWVEPGGHRGPLRELSKVDHATGESEFIVLDDTPWPDEHTAVPVEVNAGSLVIFSDHLPHYSSHNHSTQSRMAFTLHVVSGDSDWPTYNWLQRPTLKPFHMY